MGNDVVARWEREALVQAMDGELYTAGKRDGATTAAAEWPKVERARQLLLAKGMRATRDLFGRQMADRNAGYWAGWIAGYTARCAQLDGLGVH